MIESVLDQNNGDEDPVISSLSKIMGIGDQPSEAQKQVLTAQAQAKKNLDSKIESGELTTAEYAADIALAVPRGIVGAVKGAYNLADILTLDLLPDWENNPLGGSKTTVGGFVETIAEFGVGFLTGSAVLSAASKASKLGKVGSAAKWMQGSSALQKFTKSTAVGGMADFAVFEGDEMRLSNLIESVPGLSNPISEFLATKEDDSDTLANRLKNVIEGGIVGSAVEGIFRSIGAAGRLAKGIAASADVVKETRAAVEAGKSADEVAQIRDAVVEKHREALEDLDKVREEFQFELVPALDPTSLPEEIAGGIRGGNVPRKPDGSIDEEALAKLIDERADAGEGNLRPLNRERGSEKAAAAYEAVEPRAVETMSAAEQGKASAKVFDELNQLENESLARMAGDGFDAYGTALDDVFRSRIDQAAERVIELQRLPDYPEKVLDIATSLEMLSDISEPYRNTGTATARRLQRRDEFASRFGERVKLKSGGVDLPPSSAPTPPAPTGKEAKKGGGKVSDETADGAAEGSVSKKPRSAASRRARIAATGKVQIGGQTVPIARIDAALKQKGGRRLMGMIFKAVGVAPQKETAGLVRWGRMGIDMFVEAFRAFILSGTRTFATNYLGSGFAAMFTQGERALGAVVDGAFTGSSVSRALAYKEGRVLLGYSNFARDIVNLMSFNLIGDTPAAVRRTFLNGGAPSLVPNSIVSEARMGAFTPARTGLRKPKLDSTGKPVFDAMGAVDYDPTMMGKAIDWLGTVVNIPYRIMGTSDESVKFRVITENLRIDILDKLSKEFPNATAEEIDKMAAREFDDMFVVANRLYSLEALTEKAFRQAASEGLSQAQGAAFFNRVKDLVENGDPRVGFEAFDPDRAILAENASKRAVEATFQRDYESLMSDPIRGLGTKSLATVSRSAQKFVEEFPVAGLVLPFIRTPTNIIAFALDRNPASQLYNILMKETVSSDPVLRSQAVGRLVTGTAIYTSAVMLASQGLITGKGPKDKNLRRQLQSTGWQPYSIKVGEQWVSYLRAEPFSMMFGLIADMNDLWNHTYEDPESNSAVIDAGTAVIGALTNNLTSKTFLTGIATFLNAVMNPEVHGPRMLRQYAGAVVPNFFTQFSTTVGEEELLEARTALDAISARVPWFGEAPESIDRVRNALGEEIDRNATPYFDWINPYTVSGKKKDPIMEEFIGLKKGFGQPGRVIEGDIDLYQYKNRRGQSAYDRFQEITSEIAVDGKTLRRSLMELIKNPEYKSLPSGVTDGVDSPRVRMIRSQIDSYRRAAFERLLREYPDLARRYQEVQQTKGMMGR